MYQATLAKPGSRHIGADFLEKLHIQNLSYYIILGQILNGLCPNHSSAPNDIHSLIYNNDLTFNNF